jgi:hypothetical protein
LKIVSIITIGYYDNASTNPSGVDKTQDPDHPLLSAALMVHKPELGNGYKLSAVNTKFNRNSTRMTTASKSTAFVSISGE